MSALDKAFLKAYTKQTEPSGQQDELPDGGLPPGAYPGNLEGDQVILAAQSSADGRHYRIDAAHQQPGPATGSLYTSLPDALGYADSAIIGPYCDEATAARLSEVASPVERHVEEVDAPPAALPIEPPEMPPLDPQEIFDPALSKQAKLPTTLKLPALFLAPEEKEEDREEHCEEDCSSNEFSPDWEVDRFSWPDICVRLLDIESRYFRHVGERLKAATDESHHVVMVSGCRRGEGRTTLALCLARSAAAAGVQVALVDADWQNPQMGVQLGMETPCGWMEVLEGRAPLNEAAVASVEDQLTVFPLKSRRESAIRAGDKRLVQILRSISTRYPLVIVDTGPLAAEDRHAFAGDDGCPIDAAIVLRDLRYTSEKTALATAEGLQKSGIAAVGIAENFESR